MSDSVLRHCALRQKERAVSIAKRMSTRVDVSVSGVTR